MYEQIVIEYSNDKQYFILHIPHGDTIYYFIKINNYRNIYIYIYIHTLKY